MRKMIIVFLSVLSFSVALKAQDAGIGVGLSYDGLSGKYWLNSINALEVTWDLESSIDVDYTFDKPDVLNFTDAPTPVYYGGGVYLGTHKGVNDDLEETTEFHLGVRGVLGLSYYLSAYPIDIFLQTTPSLGLVGGSGFDFGGNLGLRYYF